MHAGGGWGREAGLSEAPLQGSLSTSVKAVISKKQTFFVVSLSPAKRTAPGDKLQFDGTCMASL